VTTISKKQNLHTKFFAKNKSVELTDYEAGLSDATSTEVSSQNSDEVSGSKAEKRKYKDIWKSEIPVSLKYDMISAKAHSSTKHLVSHSGH